MSDFETRQDGNRDDDSIHFVQKESKTEIAKNLLIDLSFFSVGPILSILTFCLLNNYSFSLNQGSTNALIFAVLSYILTVHLTDIFKASQARARALKINNSIIRNIKRSETNILGELENYNVSRVKASEIHTQISATIVTSRRVRNTFVNIKHLSGVSSPHSAEIVRRYQDFLSKGKDYEWHDIAGLADFFDGRYLRIFPEGVQDKQLGTHKVTVLNSPVPIINFLLAAPNDSEFTEAYFGWISNQSDNIEIFRTRDSALIGLFNSYFIRLLDEPGAMQVDMSYSTSAVDRFRGLAFQKFIGKWVSVSASALQGHIKVDPESIDYSVINITFDSRWQLRGEFKSHSGRAGEIISGNSTLVKDTIYYTFRMMDNRSMWSDGIGGWTLSPLNSSTGSSRERLNGFYSNTMEGKKRFTFAFKIGPDEQITNELVCQIIREGGLATQTSARARTDAQSAQREDSIPD